MILESLPPTRLTVLLLLNELRGLLTVALYGILAPQVPPAVILLTALGGAYIGWRLLRREVIDPYMERRWRDDRLKGWGQA